MENVPSIPYIAEFMMETVQADTSSRKQKLLGLMETVLCSPSIEEHMMENVQADTGSRRPKITRIDGDCTR